jgi:large repetitive protein
MDLSQHHCRRGRPAVPRRSFKPEFDLLETRTLLSGGLVGAVQGVPVQTGTATGGVVSSGGTTSSPGDDQSGAAVVFSKDELTVTPGGAGDSYTVVLATQPTADVTITINQAILDPLPVEAGGDPHGPPTPAPVVPPGTGGPLDVTPATLTFTPDNWNTPQAVQVSAPPSPTAAGPAVYGGPTIALLHDVTSDDPNYNGLFVPPVEVHVVDTNQAAVVISKDDLQVTRGGAGDSYTVVLATQPTADVTITIAQLDVGPVYVAADGGDPNGPPAIKPIPPPPGGNDPLQISPTTLTFTPENWNTPQTVTVGPPAAGSGDQFDLLTHTVASADPNYDGLCAPLVAVEVIDPTVGTGGLVFSKDQLDVTRGGTGDSYTVALTTQPTADVTVTISQFGGEVYAAAAGTGTAYPVPIWGGTVLDITPATLTFTPDNWNVPQAVQVSAPAVALGRGDETVALVHTVTSDDPAYQDLCVPPLTVTVHDTTPASGAGVVLSKGHLDVTPGGAGDTYTVVLASKPADTVTITIAPYAGPLPLMRAGAGQPGPAIPIQVGNVPLQITPTTLVFTPENWDTPQTVNVSAPDGKGSPVFGIDWLSHTVSSNDPDYNGLFVPPLTVSVVSPTVPPPAEPPPGVEPVAAVGPGGVVVSAAASDPPQATGAPRGAALAHAAHHRRTGKKAHHTGGPRSHRSRRH